MQALKNVMKKTANDFIYAGDEKDTGLAPVYSIEILESTAITGKACKACFCKLAGGI